MDRLISIRLGRPRSNSPDVLEGFKLLKAGFESEEVRCSGEPPARFSHDLYGIMDGEYMEKSPTTETFTLC
jgi:hypothetical protein